MPALSVAVSNNLTSLLSEFAGEPEDAADMSAGSLVRQLHLMHNLQELSLSFDHTTLNFDDPSSKCDLLSLKRFNITLSHNISSRDVNLTKFLDKINMTNVREVFIRSARGEPNLLSEENDDTHLPLVSVFETARNKPRFPNLVAATIDIEPESERGSAVEQGLMGYGLLRCEEMRTLLIRNASICLPQTEAIESEGIGKLSLREVTMEGCDHGARVFIDYLCAHVNPDGSRLSHSLEKLRIMGCEGVTMNYLLDCLPEDKVEWSPVIDVQE